MSHLFSGLPELRATGTVLPLAVLTLPPAADLFDILLPMLNIYQEFVRNHQYSLQILAHCKQNRDFDKLLKHYEAKPDCEERTLETFLTYPMFQVGHRGALAVPPPQIQQRKGHSSVSLSPLTLPSDSQVHPDTSRTTGPHAP